MIWSNIDLDLKDLKEELKAGYPDLSEEEYFAMMMERNNEYLSDEREMLSVSVEEDILVVGDIGRWDGRRMGYKTIETGKLSDCLSSECDYVEWYVDRDGEFRGREIHHDGTNYMYYRKFKESADYDDRAELMDQIYAKYCPEWNEDERRSIVISTFEFFHGLYPYAHHTEKQEEAMKQAGILPVQSTVRELALAGLRRLLA